MKDATNYQSLNRKSWNLRTAAHWTGDFYDVKGFIDGKEVLKSIELDLLGDLSGKKILHLQCHFGQDSIALARHGAQVTGIDLSDDAIAKAIELADACGQSAKPSILFLPPTAQLVGFPISTNGQTSSDTFSSLVVNSFLPISILPFGCSTMILKS